jgi:putative FmdB family regulatory protein
MPIFEYLCQECGKRFEALMLSAASSKKPECPKCHSKKLKQEISRFAVAGASAKSGGDFGGDFGGSEEAGGACGSCGDPRGPGACAMDDLD